MAIGAVVFTPGIIFKMLPVTAGDILIVNIVGVKVSGLVIMAGVAR